MSEVRCLAPDCGHTEDDADVEVAKRNLVVHMTGHGDVHVAIPCAHDLDEGEPRERRSRDARGREQVERDVVHVCRRCGNRVAKSATASEEA